MGRLVLRGTKKIAENSKLKIVKGEGPISGTWYKKN